jgi:hypothetical protein
MQAIVDIAPLDMVTVSEMETYRAARAYVAANIDPAFEVVLDSHYHQQHREQDLWRFFICCTHGPLTTLYVDAQTGVVIPLTADEIRVVREKAALLVARQQNRLPLNEQGYVIGEYARRRANGYLTMKVSLFYSAVDGIFGPPAGGPPGAIWQFSIEVRLPRLGALGIMGTIDVDAQTGEVIPLTQKQIKRIRDRADALVELRTQTAAA